jgi:hypothetical protein
MKFDITDLDKAKVLQALYKHAFVRFSSAKPEDINIQLPYDEARRMIAECTKTIADEQVVDIDSVFGVPVKLYYDTKNCVVSSYSYDSLYGKYRFLYALTSEFGTNSISLVSKKYPPFLDKPREVDKEIPDILLKEFKQWKSKRKPA